MESEFIVRTNHLYKDFKGTNIINDCNMNVRRGSIYCLVGKNGAGKTTIFKILLGLTSVTKGEAIVFDNKSQVGNLDILHRTGSILENPIFYENSSAVQNLKIHLAYRGIADDKKIENALIETGLDGITEQPVSSLSIGMRQRLAIARAIVHEPELLILDEPIDGLDALGIKMIRKLFRKLSKQGTSIILSSHLLSEVELVADYVAFLNNGTIVEEVETKNMISNRLEDYFMKNILKEQSYEYS